jgi:endonuclease/exonuclease/phosphatase family metal-dependent hydrolase
MMAAASFSRVIGVAVVLVTGCATAYNYPHAAGPWFGGSASSVAPQADTLKVIVFNVAYARRVDRAVAMVRKVAALRQPDIVLLQEMDEPGTRAFADSLGLGYVYFPSTLHPTTGRDFGNAVLSRYPIENERKIVLPFRARWRHTLRAAVGATIVVGERRVRVYSVHIATFIGNGPGARRAQLEAVLADADSFPIVVLGGDFNSSTVPEVALRRGYTWPTRRLGRTEAFWSMDHILLKGIALAQGVSSGLVRDDFGASDHTPVWTRIVISPPDTVARTATP